MDFSSLKTAFPFLAVFGTIGLAWNQIRGFVNRFFSFFVNKIELKDYAAGAVSTYIWQNFVAVDTGTYKYHASTFQVKRFTNSILIGSKRLSDKYQLFFYGKIPILAKYKDWEERHVMVCFVRKTINFDKLFSDAIENWNYLILNNKNRFRIETLIGRDRGLGTMMIKGGSEAGSESSAPISVSTSSVTFDSLQWLTGKTFKYGIDDLGKDYDSFLKSYILDDELLEIEQEIKMWLELKDWYKNKGLVWRRGYLTHGRPGVGKTVFVRTIGTKFNLPIFRFDLSSMTNKDFIENWERIGLEAPCIVLIEDVDAVFNKRENISKLENGLSFDCFLNVISGAMPAEGVLLFITTNKIETLDSAIANLDNGMASRPGRVDKIIEVKNLSLNKKEELAKLILDDFPEEVGSVMLGAENLTNAQFTEKCSQVALKRLWNKKI